MPFYIGSEEFNKFVEDNYKTIKDFVSIIGISETPLEVYGLFSRMQLFPEIGVVRILNTRLKLNDKPSGSLEFVSKYGNLKLSDYAKNLIYNFGIESWIVDKPVDIRPSKSAIGVLVNFLDRQFNQKWNNLLDTVEKHYDFLTPFDITLTETSNDVKNINKNRTDTSNDSNNRNGTSSVLNNETIDSIYPFGSDNETNTDKSVNKSNDSYNESSTTSGSSTTTDKNNENITHSRNYTRSGNIGNSSYAKLTEEERKKAMFNIYDIVFSDIASVLGKPIWND